MLRLFIGHDGYYYVIDEEGKAIGCGHSPLEAACNAASEEFNEGSALWHVQIAHILMDSNLDVLNYK